MSFRSPVYGASVRGHVPGLKPATARRPVNGPEALHIMHPPRTRRERRAYYRPSGGNARERASGSSPKMCGTTRAPPRPGFHFSLGGGHGRHPTPPALCHRPNGAWFSQPGAPPRGTIARKPRDRANGPTVRPENRWPGTSVLHRLASTPGMAPGYLLIDHLVLSEPPIAQKTSDPIRVAGSRAISSEHDAVCTVRTCRAIARRHRSPGNS